MKFPFNSSRGKNKARDDGRGDYSRIQDSPEAESHELAGDIAQRASASGTQAGPSGLSSSRELENAENLRQQARKKGEERAEFHEHAQDARALGLFDLAKVLMKLAKKCWKAMKWLNRQAADIIFICECRRIQVGPRVAEGS